MMSSHRQSSSCCYNWPGQSATQPLDSLPPYRRQTTCTKLKKSKPDKFFMGKLSQNFGVSPKFYNNNNFNKMLGLQCHYQTSITAGPLYKVTQTVQLSGNEMLNSCHTIMLFAARHKSTPRLNPSQLSIIE